MPENTQSISIQQADQSVSNYVKLLQSNHLLSPGSQRNLTDISTLFMDIACDCSEEQYTCLLNLTATFIQIGLCQHHIFDSSKFTNAFWQNWQKRNHAKILWQEKQQIYIGIYTPNQPIDIAAISFKYQCKCVTILLHDQHAVRLYAQQQKKNQHHDISTVDVVESLINAAIAKNASDIHIEPYQNLARIRFRCDGVLMQYSQTEHKHLQNMLSRLKVLSNLDIAEKRRPQDGRMLFKSDKFGNRDLRVSCMPTIFGEKMVLRILTRQAQNMPLNALGLNNDQLNLLHQALQNRHGMILTTGPTGSGKTNTLYSLIAALNNEDVNIVSVEDPVEIYLNGINQINTNTKAGLTFANALRGLLRQDPDIIMVGEIRDSETADIAIKAAQTGHLLLSSLHTNDAIGSVARLSDMGIANYRLNAALKILIAQRLLRRLCQNCKQPQPYDKTIWQRYDLCSDHTIYQAKGCAACLNGYAGRIGIFEIIRLNYKLFQAIIKNQPESINALLAEQQYSSLQKSAIEKLKQGMTSVNEIERTL